MLAESTLSAEKEQRKDYSFDRVVAGGFVAFLCLPLAAMALHAGDDSQTLAFEVHHPAPTWSWSPDVLVGIPKVFQEYFDAHFPFRGALTEAHAWLKVRALGVSSSSDVTLGKDGWLFYAGESVVDSYRRVHPFSDAELGQWAHALVSRRDWLRARGIPYLFLIAPDPQTIYSEEMPDNLWRVAGPSRLDQLTGYVRSYTDVEILDLRPVLLRAKGEERVYYKTDTHWNQLGGFVAYEQIGDWMKARFPEWRPDSLEEFDRRDAVWTGSLTYMLGSASLFREERVNLASRAPEGVLTDSHPLPQDETLDSWTIRPVVVRESADGEIPRAVIFRDSQMAAPAKFLSRHFARAVLLWQYRFDARAVEREHPNVVIQEMVERSLAGPPPRDDDFGG